MRARAARAFSIAATFGAVILVPLLYLPALSSPFLLLKEVGLEVAAALGFGAFLLAITAGPRPQVPGARAVMVGAALVLSSGLLSAALAPAEIGAPYAVATLGRWAALFGLACGAAVAVADPVVRAGVIRAAAVTAACVSAIGILQHVDLFPLAIPVISPPGSTFGNRNLGGEAVALAIPLGLAAVALARGPTERWIFLAALALDFLYLGATRARGAWLGAAAGVATVALLSRRSLSRTVIAPALGIAVLALVVALLPARANPRYASDAKRLAGGVEIVEISFDPDSPALRTRLALWRRSLAMYAGSPLTGIGPGNWPVLFPRYAEPDATADGALSPGLAPRHAHNDLLEVLTETGALGLVSLLVLGFGVVAAARRQIASDDALRRTSTSAAAGTLAAFVAAGFTGFPMQMPATLVLAALSLGLIFSGDRGSAARRPLLPGWAAAALSLALLSFALIASERRIRASAWLGVAERALHTDVGAEGAERAVLALYWARSATPGSFRIALRTAHATARLRLMAAAASAAEAGLAVEPFSPNAWAALAAAQLGSSHPRAARESADRSLHLLHDYPYALYVRARAAEAVGDRIAAEADWASLATIAAPTWPDRETSDSAQALLRMRHGVTQRPPTNQASTAVY